MFDDLNYLVQSVGLTSIIWYFWFNLGEPIAFFPAVLEHRIMRNESIRLWLADFFDSTSENQS